MSARPSVHARLNANWSDASRRRLIVAWNEGLAKAAIRKRWGIGPGVDMKNILVRLSREFGIPLIRHSVRRRGSKASSPPGRARRAAKSFRKATKTVMARDSVTPILAAAASPSSGDVCVTITQDRTYSRNPATLIRQALHQALTAPPIGKVVIYDAAGTVVTTQSPEEFKREAWAATIARRQDRAELNRN